VTEIDMSRQTLTHQAEHRQVTWPRQRSRGRVERHLAGGKYKPYLLTHHASRRASTHAFHRICNHGNRMFIKRQCVVKKVRNVSVVTKL